MIDLLFNRGSLIVTIIIAVSTLLSKGITLYNSSELELKLGQKERYTLHNIVRYVINIMINSFYLSILTFMFNNTKYYDFIVVIVLIYISLSLILIIVYTFKGQTFSDLISMKKRKYEKYIKIGALIWMILVYLVIPYTFSGILEMKTETLNEVIGQLLALLLVFIILVVTFDFSLLRIIIKPFFKLNDEKITYIKIDDYIWYLFHAVDKDVFLLGDKKNHKDCTKYKLINKDELMKYELMVTSSPLIEEGK